MMICEGKDQGMHGRLGIAEDRIVRMCGDISYLDLRGRILFK